MKKWILVISFLFLMTSCATKHMARPDKSPGLKSHPDKASLVIIRETSFGGDIVFWNYLDHRLIGETMGKTYFITSVTPGPHYVVIETENKRVAQFDFKAGKTYFLGEGVSWGFWRARTSGFFPMTPEDAIKAMSNCTYLEYDPQTGQEVMDSQSYRQAIDQYLEDLKENPDAFKDILKYDGVVIK